MIAKGHNRDTAYFSMLDGEWPDRKRSLERWLLPDNFDRDGRQKISLAAFNAAKATGSSGSNLGPINPALLDNARARIEALQAADEAAGYQRPAGQKIPVDLVTASGSGLDPHISLAAAEYQVPRVARARGLPEEQVRTFVREHTQERQIGFLGEPCVNVVQLNLSLTSPAAP